ncbi:beta-lactamase family protein [Planctomycetaceae bacterium]|jgi:CubicO group peptidase (beta-lactamase class C family)|nr:beta-lactamase family protein [Planctomycetaceae bacterium]MDB4786669.1 beta-lactamase family protein [Planctomycetaceae bacterium]MDC0308545.1 beta-lactamase family protein [Planctomycetaceae bacterium]
MPSHRHKYVLLLISIAAIMVCDISFAQRKSCDSQTVSLDAPKFAQIAEVLEKERDAGRISGAVTLVAKNGTVVDITNIGMADLEAERKMTDESLFCIASMTKPITATALILLVEEGKVSVDDRVSKYIPEFAEIKLKSGEAPEPVTIRHCMTHTAGLYGDQQVVSSLEEHMQVLLERGLAFPPGTKWQYSPGLNVCGRIIEVVSGKPYHEFLKERLFRPLKMANTTFFPTKAQQQRIARVYQPGDEEGTLKQADHWLTDFSDARVANPSGGLVSSAADMAKFYQFILNGATIGNIRYLSEKTVREMTTIQTEDLVTGFTPGNGWGYGWCVVREPQGITAAVSPGTYGHGGLFGTQGWVDPERQMIFVLMIQRSNFGNSDGSDLRRDFQKAAVDAVK